MNVYTLCQVRFAVQFRQEDWERLKTVGRVFKCEECNVWQRMEVRTPDFVADMCQDCFSEMDE